MIDVKDGDLFQRRGGAILRWPRLGVAAHEVIRVLTPADITWLKVRRTWCAVRGLHAEAAWMDEVIKELEQADES